MIDLLDTVDRQEWRIRELEAALAKVKAERDEAVGLLREFVEGTKFGELQLKVIPRHQRARDFIARIGSKP